MEKQKIVFIVNPISGIVKKKNVDTQIDLYIDKEKYDYHILNTEYAAHALDMAMQAVNDGADIVVAVGGDGSVNEVVNGLEQVPIPKSLDSIPFSS